MKLLVVAGEASGDRHGAALLHHLQRQVPNLETYGIGGHLMLQQGLRPYHMLDALQVHGLVEVLRHLPRLYRILWNLRDSLDEEKPDAVLLVDYPGFNLKLAAYAKSRGIPVLFFNSPQVWAWRKGRIHKIAAIVDKLIVQFPFEEELYASTPVDAKFWGHPLLETLPDPSDVLAFRDALGIAREKRVVALGPGSRPSELERHLPVLLEAAALLNQQLPDLHFLLPIAHGLKLEEARQQAQGFPVQVVEGNFELCVHVATVAAVASGTATLQTGLAGVPFVLIYKVAPVSFWLAQQMAEVEHLGIVNILAKREIIPELLQNDLTPSNLAAHLSTLLTDPAVYSRTQDDLEQVRQMLGEPGAYARAAADYVAYLEQRQVLRSPRTPS
jgi:lipid-A-disaccharide synthase